MVLKLDEANKELKTLRRSYEILAKDYSLEKQGKCQAENEFECLKKVVDAIRKERDEAVHIARKVRQLKEDNRFYKNVLFHLFRKSSS
jgi:hypothetical protein